MKRIFIAASALFVTQFCLGQKAQVVIDAEKAFAKHAIDFTTKQAFLRYMDSNAVVFNRGNVTNGIQTWLQIPESPGKLIWGPSYAAISNSGDLGFTTGPYEVRINDTLRGSGQYTTVWTKTKHGWKFLVDLGTIYRPSEWGKQLLSPSFTGLTPANTNDTSVMELENKFIQAFTANGYKAYENVSDQNTWYNFDRKTPVFPIKAEELNFIPAEIKFTPLQGRTSSAKDLAYVYGITDINGKKENYLRVWAHTVNGWKLLVQVLKWQN